MFTTYIHTAIDTIQGAKKVFVKNFITHEELSSILNKFVDAQTEYTKKAIDVGVNTATSVVNLGIDQATNYFLFKTK